eukprot:Gregarina_sp_Poly_1__5689@NODE_29_length_19459_cov_103_994070_g26_i0_p7_GENE_NODE_29_length_19459_cov_103_994070_g26_i0NODE_29_length_19459_cov_103_994070_g26_i0_p7_ORF_typecomplete_len241_score27_16_NODE_29_length_19459_cov_103_994070_g26_i01329114013
MMSPEPAAKEWHINVSRYYHYTPSSGFVVRWTAGGPLSKFTYVAVLIRDASLGENEDEFFYPLTWGLPSLQKKIIPWASLRRDELLLFFPVKAVKIIQTLSGSQKELRVPAAHHGLRRKEYETTQKWVLKLDKRYRIKILGCDRYRTIIAASSWSDASVLYQVISPTDWVQSFYRLFMPLRTASLPYFIHKYCRPVCPFVLPFHLKNLQLVAESLEIDKMEPQSINHFITVFSVDPRILV